MEYVQNDGSNIPHAECISKACDSDFCISKTVQLQFGRSEKHKLFEMPAYFENAALKVDYCQIHLVSWSGQENKLFL